METHPRPRVDATLTRLVERLEAAFPGRIRGYYLHGSVADHTSLETSDVDLDVVVKGSFRDAEERAGLIRIAAEVAAESDLELDIEVVDEAFLEAGAEPTFKLGSTLIHGQDIRPSVPLIPVEEWGRERMYRGYYLMIRVFDRPTPVRLPLGFPDPNAEFFGYTNRPVTLADGSVAPSTRNLIRVTGWLATALIAHEGRRFVVRKRDCHRLYGEVFEDEWAGFLEEIYHTCRVRWRSLVPSDPVDREHLRALCARALGFENHFLMRFKPFVLAELQRTRGETQSRAEWLVREIPFEDEDVRAALERKEGGE